MRRTTFARKTNGNSEKLHSTLLNNKRRLPKIKAWIDQNNPGDPLIPFSVAFEERLVSLSAEEKKAEEEKAGATSALGKITQAGYTSLDVCKDFHHEAFLSDMCHSSYVISPVVPTRFVLGLLERARKLPKLLGLSSTLPADHIYFKSNVFLAPISSINLSAARSCPSVI